MVNETLGFVAMKGSLSVPKLGSKSLNRPARNLAEPAALGMATGRACFWSQVCHVGYFLHTMKPPVVAVI